VKERFDAVGIGIGEMVLGRSRKSDGEQERGVADELGGCGNAN